MLLGIYSLKNQINHTYVVAIVSLKEKKDAVEKEVNQNWGRGSSCIINKRLHLLGHIV